jgi:hypothetical protein
MSGNKMTSLASRIFFGVALLALLFGALEKIVNLAGYTILRVYTPERLLEISVAFAVLVMVVLLRQIRQELRAYNRSL